MRLFISRENQKSRENVLLKNHINPHVRIFLFTSKGAEKHHRVHRKKNSICQKLNSSSVSVLHIGLSKGSGNEIYQLHQWFCFKTKSCPLKYRKISAKVLNPRAMYWIFQISSRTQPTNMVIALCQGFSILCLGKGCVVIFIKNLCPALVNFEIGN